MRNLIKSILILFISIYSVNAFAATGAATEYGVTMTKLELCETGSTTANCLNPLTISPSGTSGVVDIASVDAGATAGSYGNIAKAKIGTLYTFIQITMSRQFTMTGTAGSCATKAGESGTKTTDAKGQTGGTPGSSTLYVPDGSSSVFVIAANRASARADASRVPAARIIGLAFAGQATERYTFPTDNITGMASPRTNKSGLALLISAWR